MASEVDIVNLALTHFGQRANVSSIDPPEASAEAIHGARFYPIARDELLEEGTWTFATRRLQLTEMTNDREDWAYKYALPNLCIKPRIMLPDGYGDDLVEGVPFQLEGSALYTDAEDAHLVYTFRQTDPTKFTPLFVTALSWRLASYLSGPITKDPTGRIQKALYDRSLVELGKAESSNANASPNRRQDYRPLAQRVR